MSGSSSKYGPGGNRPVIKAANTSSATGGSEARSAQIVALLNRLGDRLVQSEQERMAVREELTNSRDTLDRLESRADQSERLFLTIQDKISKQDSIESAIAERQKALEAIVQENAERMKQAEALSARIEEAIASQDRLARRLEKTAQDKAQILSKIERIEARVEQTHEAIGAGALLDPAALRRLMEAEQQGALPAGPWWTRPYRMRAATFASILVAALLGGAAMTQMIQHWPGIAYVPPAVEGTAGLNETGAFAPATQPQAQNDLVLYGSTPPDIPASDAERVSAMETDPDMLASALNEIAPGDENSVVPDDIAAEMDVAAVTAAPETRPNETRSPEPAAAVAPKSAPAATPAQADAASQAFIATEAGPRTPLRERMQPDSTLPDMVKKVEEKAFAGVAEAQHDLAAIYTAGHGGVKVNYTRAAFWFKEAAVQGVANARYNLGVLYHQGLGVPRDITKAIGWYRAAADLGHPEAQYNLGIAYIEGIGTNYNAREAARYFESAARGGVKEAAYNLGLIHENGLLGQADMNEAVFWYKTAADHSPEAKVAFDQVVKALGLRSSDVDRIMQEYGRVYKLSASAPAVKPTLSDPPVKVAALRPDDYGTPDTIRPMIPKLGAEESRQLIDSLSNDHTVTAQIQEQLIRLGLYSGPADGVPGQQTLDAISSYQKSNKLPVNGKPSEDLLVHMLASEITAAGIQ